MRYCLLFLMFLFLIFPVKAKSQVPTSARGWVTFVMPSPEGPGIGYNFGLFGGDGSTETNVFSYSKGAFSLSTHFPLVDPHLLVLFTGTTGEPTIVAADTLGCYYVYFDVTNGLLTVEELNGTILKQFVPSDSTYWQEFCSLDGGGNNFWSAGGLNVLHP